MKKQISNARTSFIHIFLQVVKENHKKVSTLEVQLRKLEMKYADAKDEDHRLEFWGKAQTLEGRLANASLIVIVFSAMVLEAYIYDYAARYLTDDFVKDHLDKLDPVGKWVIVPALITGQGLSRRPDWQGPLRQLIKARNSVIHHKSAALPPPSLDIKRYFEKRNSISTSLLETAKRSPQTLHLLADKIAEVHPEETPWVNSYLI